jgi:transposase
MYRLRAGQSVRAICRDLGRSRRTVRRYRKLAAAKGYLDPSRPLPEAAEVLAHLGPVCSAPSSNVSSVEPYREVVQSLLNQGIEMVAIHQRLVRHHGYGGSYSSVRRFVHHLRPRGKEAVVRMESPPGQCAQVDFGGAGKMLDPATGRLRQTYCFVMTLAYSRHQYVEFVFDQRMETWIGCHQRAFESFGGVPRELVIDNAPEAHKSQGGSAARCAG